MSEKTRLTPGMFSSRRDDWETPQTLFDELDKEFKFTVDVASNTMNHKCDRYYTVEDDGLQMDWGGESVFCNPPYGRGMDKWASKCYREAQKPGTTCVLLIPSRTDTRTFHDWILDKAEIRFIKGRLKYELNGIAGDAAPFPSLIAIYRAEDKVVSE